MNNDMVILVVGLLIFAGVVGWEYIKPVQGCVEKGMEEFCNDKGMELGDFPFYAKENGLWYLKMSCWKGEERFVFPLNRTIYQICERIKNETSTK